MNVLYRTTWFPMTLNDLEGVWNLCEPNIVEMLSNVAFDCSDMIISVDMYSSLNLFIAITMKDSWRSRVL